jgi:hypothetical protein
MNARHWPRPSEPATVTWQVQKVRTLLGSQEAA